MPYAVADTWDHCFRCGETAINRWHNTPFQFQGHLWWAMIFCEQCYQEMTIPERLDQYRASLADTGRQYQPFPFHAERGGYGAEIMWPGLAEAVWSGK